MTQAQTERLLHGLVRSNEKPLGKVDLVNLTTKKNTTTDANGKFSLWATAGDVIYVLTKDYIDVKITLTEGDFERIRTIVLQKKPIELKEVAITNIQKPEVAVSSSEIEMARLARQESAPKVVGSYSGDIPLGFDLVKIFKNLFGSKKKKKAVPLLTQEVFTSYIFTTFQKDSLFLEVLDLPVEQSDLFLSYCFQDPICGELVAKQDNKTTLEFLLKKASSFVSTED